MALSFIPGMTRKKPAPEDQDELSTALTDMELKALDCCRCLHGAQGYLLGICHKIHAWILSLGKQASKEKNDLFVSATLQQIRFLSNSRWS